MTDSLQSVLRQTKTITFDCYGTLIDWEAGLRGTLQGIFGQETLQRVPSLFDAYVEAEAEVEAGPYRSYREVLAEVVRRLARRFDLPLAAGAEHQLATELAGWRPFADTNDALRRLKSRYRLGALSNIDRDLFAETARHFSVSFDFIITAEDVRSYKPHHAHFHRAIAEHGPAETMLHAAQSLYHDGQPAGALGLAYVWINRYKQCNDTAVRPQGEFMNLESLATAAGV